MLQNVAIYLFKYFVSHNTVIPQNDTFLYYRTNQISSVMVYYEIFLRLCVTQKALQLLFYFFFFSFSLLFRTDWQIF